MTSPAARACNGRRLRSASRSEAQPYRYHRTGCGQGGNPEVWVKPTSGDGAPRARALEQSLAPSLGC